MYALRIQGLLPSEERRAEDEAEAAVQAEAEAAAQAEAAAEGGGEEKCAEGLREERQGEEGWGEEDADEQAALETAIDQMLSWQEQVHVHAVCAVHAACMQGIASVAFHAEYGSVFARGSGRLCSVVQCLQQHVHAHAQAHAPNVHCVCCACPHIPAHTLHAHVQVVRENQQAAELLPLRAQVELSRAPARARTRELQCGDW